MPASPPRKIAAPIRLDGEERERDRQPREHQAVEPAEQEPGRGFPGQSRRPLVRTPRAARAH